MSHFLAAWSVPLIALAVLSYVAIARGRRVRARPAPVSPMPEDG